MNPTEQQLKDPDWWCLVAPRGATHFDPEDDETPWMKNSVAGWHVYHGGEWSFPFDSDDEWIVEGNFNRCIERPTTQWRGMQDGLPSKGTECEVDTRFGWLPGKIVDHGDDYAVAHLHENEHNLKVEWSRTGFRPIQSERDKSIAELEETIYKNHWVGMPTPKGIAQTVWDLGWRKPMSRSYAFDLVCDVVADGDSMTCPQCSGERSVFVGVTGGPSGPIEHFEDCDLCSGRGVLEVDIDQILDSLGY